MGIAEGSIKGTGLMSAGHVASIFNVTRETVCNWARAGRIPGLWTGAQWRFRRTDVAQMFEAFEKEGAGRTVRPAPRRRAGDDLREGA